MQGWLSSRYRLILLVAAILITGFAATNIINYQISKNSIRTSILENELPLSSNTIYSEIQADLLRPVFVSSLMARDTFLRDWVLAGEQSADPMIRYLEEIRDKYDARTSFFISAKTLNYYHYSGVSRQINLQDPADSWFIESRNMAREYAINLDYNVEHGNELTVFINYKVMDYNNNFIGIAGVGLGLSTVSSLIQQYQDNFRRAIYFVDKQGYIRLHSEQQLAGKSRLQEREGITDIADKILNTDRGSFTYQRNGEVILLTTRFLPELNWYVLVELKEADATAAIRRSLELNLLIGAAVVVLIVVFTAIAINGFHRRLEIMAITDKLSGLGNRQLFDQALQGALQRIQKQQQDCALLLLDIDHFKHINDELGHAVGDQVIQNVASKLQSLVRTGDVLCRWGGEEFVVLAANCSAEQASQLAEQIRLALQQSQLIPNASDRVITISAGLTNLCFEDDALSVFSRADQALYRAKEKGRNCVEYAANQ